MKKQILSLMVSTAFLVISPAFAMEEDPREGALVQSVKKTSNPDVSFETKKVIISNTTPFLQAIENAEGFLYAGAFKLQSKQLNLNPKVAEAFQRTAQSPELKGNIVLILEDNLTPEEQKSGSGDIKSGDGREPYEALGISLRHGSHPNTHFKILASEKYGVVGTTNFDKDFEEAHNVTRDFALILNNPTLIKELKDVFESDIASLPSKLPDFDIPTLKFGETRLSWGPTQHRQHFQSLIQTATTSIEIYQQAMQDESLTNHLADVIKRGVKVSILMSQYPFGPKHGNKSEPEQRKIVSTPSPNERSKGEVRLTGQPIPDEHLRGKTLHIHAKVVIVDGTDLEKAFMYLGSANFYTPAIDKDRNVGIITRDPDYIAPVRAQFLQDWDAHKGYGLGQ